MHSILTYLQKTDKKTECHEVDITLVSIRMARYQVCQILLLSFLASSLACPNVCPQVKLTSEGGFAHDYPRFLGTWVYSGEWNGNPWFFCSDCQGLRAYVVRRSKGPVYQC